MHTHLCSQARTELLSSLAVIHATLGDQLGAGDIRLILGWMDRMARFPIGAGAGGCVALLFISVHC